MLVKLCFSLIFFYLWNQMNLDPSRSRSTSLNIFMQIQIHNTASSPPPKKIYCRGFGCKYLCLHQLSLSTVLDPADDEIHQLPLSTVLDPGDEETQHNHLQQETSLLDPGVGEKYCREPGCKYLCLHQLSLSSVEMEEKEHQQNCRNSS